MSSGLPHNQLIILDTNVLLHLARGNGTGQAINAKYVLSARPEKPILSTVVEGELRGFAAWRGWGIDRLSKLDGLLNELVRLPSSEPEVVSAYAELFAHQLRKGLKIGENDLWIAASARAVDAIVLTCDTDFKKLDPQMVKYEYFDPKTK
jgi:tRNA(fMet)-specific endonuclease VapC